MNYKIVLQYDGGRYKGFQKQTGTKENESTIQGKLESVIKTYVGHDVSLVGCGRTDAGVHSENYTANFNTDDKIDEKGMLNHFDKYLPEDIYVKEISEVSDRFHSRYNVYSKTYQYRISSDRNRNVFTRKYAYHINDVPNVEKMKKAAELLVGERDFSGFTNLKSKTKSTVRKIYDIVIYQDNYGEVVIEIEGNGFLQNMVRIIAGTLLEVGTGSRDINSVQEILKNGSREDAGVMVPSQGLKLLKVKY
ncbi:tRNA pseudouridine(38-40) synthase TruA [Proteocatella sphenisci]|uniref:tRNA pseudouridine(38-40) synthase TruA n=1 Tax=Proteocatella sphenisci TaxID=181070 RepID=UPI0004ADA60F|nr:tRNA pseudouridine(38-40) synthase TruA [Proteocatella sphenisci]